MVNTKIREAINLNQWRNTETVTDWFVKVFIANTFTKLSFLISTCFICPLLGTC